MSLGLAGISVSPHATPPPPPGPPFVATSADNGLSVDPVTGRIVLGNDTGLTAAQLLSDREIPMNGRIFQMTQGGNPMFYLDSLNSFYVIGSVTDSCVLLVDGVSSIAGLGDTNGVFSGINFNIDGINAFATIQTGLNRQFLNIDPGNGRYRIGDINALLNATTIDVNDTLSDIGLNTAGTLSMNGTPGFTGTVTPVVSITVLNGIVTNVL